MKLLARYNRVNLITSIIIMLVTGFAYYQAISWTLTHQKDKDLKDEEAALTAYAATQHRLPLTLESKHQQITFTKVRPGSVIRRLIDTPYFKKWGKDNPKRLRYHKNGEYEAGRALITPVVAGADYYRVIIMQSKAETEDLIRIIFSITIGVILLLLIILMTTNRLILSRLWRPFYMLMDELKAFDISGQQQLNQPDTGIDEFSYLNQVVADMTARAKNDYQLLKTFTENASHELLTPIAIVNSRLDNLIQTDTFSERQSKALNDLYRGVSRLNRLNQALLLLVKIEDDHIKQEQELLDLKELLEETIDQLDDLFSDKQLDVSAALKPKHLMASRNMMEILFSNLLTNAMRHNYAGGSIVISLDDSSFSISNTGEADPLPAGQIFTRFYKSAGSQGNGLGLTIARQICENLGLTLTYNFSAPHHIFTITFLK